MALQYITPEGMHQSPAFSQGIIIPAGARLLLVGGQNAVDANGEIVGKGDIGKMPVIRTLAPISAGGAGMPYRTFFFYNVAGGFLWAGGIVGLGYLLGDAIPGVDGFLLPLVMGIIIISLLPSFVEIMAMRSKRS